MMSISGGVAVSLPGDGSRASVLSGHLEEISVTCHALDRSSPSWYASVERPSVCSVSMSIHMKKPRSPRSDTMTADSNDSPSQVQPTGSCLICDGSINRRSLVRHLKTCMNTHGREKIDNPSFLLHFSPVGLSRYYLVVLVEPEATFYDLDHLLKYVLKADEDRSSRFQFEEQYYFSHMNDGHPGMNFPIRSSPVLHESFLYLLFGPGWYPTVITGKLMGDLPYAPKNGESVEVVAVNEVPEKYHIWPQRPK